MEQSDDLVHLDDIAAFVTVVRSGGVGRAAQQLGLPKSTISRRLARLEAALELRLIERTTRRMRLSDVGAAYYDRVAPALAALADASVRTRESTHGPAGIVRVTASEDFGEALLPEIVVAFTRLYPAVQVHAVITDRQVDLVGEGVDLAIRAAALRDSSLVARKVADIDLCLFASPEYLARRGRPTTVAALAEHDLVLFRPRGATVNLRLDGPEGKTTVVVRGQVAACDFSFVRRAVLLGAGIGYMPQFLAVRDLVDGRLSRVLDGWGRRGAPLYLVHVSRQHLPERVRVLRDFIADWLSSRRGLLSG
jgi:DNA-binding transcriptional LysR family regulator